MVGNDLTSWYSRSLYFQATIFETFFFKNVYRQTFFLAPCNGRHCARRCGHWDGETRLPPEELTLRKTKCLRVKTASEAHGRDSVWGKARFCVHPDLPSEDGTQVMLINIAEGVVPGPTASTPRGPHPRPAESETREGAGRVWATNPPDDFEKCSGVSATGLEQVTVAWGHTRPSTCFCESSVTWNTVRLYIVWCYSRDRGSGS